MPNVFGDAAHGQPDSGEPVKMGAVARTSAPTAVNNAARVNRSSDIYGRAIDNVYYIRNIVTTASAAITRVLETSIMAGNASNYLDLLTITAINTTGVAVQVNLRSGTGGTIYDGIQIAANSSVTRNYSPALLQSEIGQSWTAQTTQSGDISDNPVILTMLAIQNPGI